MNNNIKTVRQFINSLKEAKVDKWGNILRTQIIWVDELPREEELWYEEEPESYSGYRNMAQWANIEKINEYVSRERETYNAGALGYCLRTSVLYIRKDIWTKFRLGEPQAAPTYKVHTLRVRLNITRDLGYSGKIVSKEIRIVELPGDTQDSVKERLWRLHRNTEKKLREQYERAGWHVLAPFGGTMSDYLHDGEEDI